VAEGIKHPVQRALGGTNDPPAASHLAVLLLAAPSKSRLAPVQPPSPESEAGTLRVAQVCAAGVL